MSEVALFEAEAYYQEPIAPVNLQKDPYRDWESPIKPWPSDELPIVVNHERVDKVLDKIMDAYWAKEPPYNLTEARPPHIPENMPKTLERGSKDHAMFHFVCCYYMRGGIKSYDAYTRLGQVYDARPDLFDCKKVVANLGEEVAEEPIDTEKLAEEFEADTMIDHDVTGIDPMSRRSMVEQDIAATLKHFGLGFQQTTARLWVENAVRMTERYDGDPREIFKGVDTYEAAVQRIKNDKRGGGFGGFQEKMVSMITYFLMDEGMIDSFKFPIPVDIHVLRVSILNGLIEFPGVPYNTDLMRPQTTATLRDVYLNYAVRKDVDPLRLCDAVWLLSGLLCSKAPGNWTIEPKRRFGRDGRRTVLIVPEENPNNPAQMAAYNNSCRICPVEETCTGRIGSADYYIAGALAVRGERLRFPDNSQEKLFSS